MVVRTERFASRAVVPPIGGGVAPSAAPGLPLTAAEARQVDTRCQSCGAVVEGEATTSEWPPPDAEENQLFSNRKRRMCTSHGSGSVSAIVSPVLSSEPLNPPVAMKPVEPG